MALNRHPVLGQVRAGRSCARRPRAPERADRSERRSGTYTLCLAPAPVAVALGILVWVDPAVFLSDRTGAIIDKKMLMLSYPSRWRFDILRGLAYFARADIEYDQRLAPALDVLIRKRRSDGTWPVQARHPGEVHFLMERTGGASRWNTLRALRVLEAYRYG